MFQKKRHGNSSFQGAFVLVFELNLSILDTNRNNEILFFGISVATKVLILSRFRYLK